MIPKVVVGTEIKMKKLEIKDLLRVLRSKFWIVIAAVVICAALSFSYCAFLATPLYSSSAIIAVTTGGISNDNTETKNQTMTTAAVSTSLNMLPTYIGALRNGGLLYEMTAERLSQRAGEFATSKTYSAVELKQMVTWTYVDDELNVTLTVKSKDPKDAYIIAKEIADTADSYLKVPYRYSAATVINSPNSAKLSYPNQPLFIVAAALLGLVVSVAIIYIYAITDNTVKNEDDLIENGFTVLGSVPDLNETSKGGAYCRV